MKRALVLINQNSGQAAHANVGQMIRRQAWGLKVDVIMTRSLAHAVSAIESIKEDTNTALIVAGGDGTLNQLLPTIIQANVPVGILPAGTANDLALELGITRSWVELEKLILSSATRSIDLISVNDSYYSTVGGIGLGAPLTQTVNGLRQKSAMFRQIWRRLSSEAYGLMAAQIALTSTGYYEKVRLQARGIDIVLDSVLTLVCNQGSLGRDLSVAPNALNDDQLFEVVVLARMSKLKLINAIRNAKLGRAFFADHRFQAPELTITSLTERPLQVFGDGEPLFAARSLNFKIVPKAMRVFSHQKKK
jgi:diacylglycerol kinase family enzyme